MTKKGLRTCCVCHQEHMYCPVCNPEDRNKPTWYFAYCSENCKDIYAATSDYENGNISADDAKKQLDKLDLSQIANFGESYQKAIMKINENIKLKMLLRKMNLLFQTRIQIFQQISIIENPKSKRLKMMVILNSDLENFLMGNKLLFNK